jgi:hypothetical protein
MKHQVQTEEVGIQRKCLKQSSKSCFKGKNLEFTGQKGRSVRDSLNQAHVGQYERSAGIQYTRVSNKKVTQKENEICRFLPLRNHLERYI